MSIEKRVNKAKKGNEKAFQALIEIEKHKLYRIAYLYVKKEEDALDVVQETIYKAFTSIMKKKVKNEKYEIKIIININALISDIYSIH